jgi:hypothetical protein
MISQNNILFFTIIAVIVYFVFVKPTEKFDIDKIIYPDPILFLYHTEYIKKLDKNKAAAIDRLVNNMIDDKREFGVFSIPSSNKKQFETLFNKYDAHMKASGIVR